MSETATFTTLTSSDVCELAGVTFRQLDYWCRNGVITPLVESTSSGEWRVWDVDQLPTIALLGRVSRGVASCVGRGGASLDVLRRIATASDVGRLDLGDGVSICWGQP